MSLVCWNCRGMGNSRAVGSLLRIRNTKNPRLLFLSETFMGKEGMENIRATFGYTGCLVAKNRGHSGGLALLWDKELDVTLLSFSYNYIDVVVENWGVQKWRFTGIYGFPGNNKRATWDLMRFLAVQSSYPWVIGGDFNCMLRRNEKCGGVRIPDSIFNGFRNTLSDCNLSEISQSGFKFTWKRGNTREKLDRFFANGLWIALFPVHSAVVLAKGSSDHNPISLTLEHVVQTRKRVRFHFEDYWVARDSCRKIFPLPIY